MAPVNPGQLRHRIVIQTAQTTRTAVGRITEWSTVDTVWGRVMPINERIVWDRTAPRGEATHRIIMRGSIDVSLPSSRFVWDGKVYLPFKPETGPNGDGSWTSVLVRHEPEQTA